MSLLSSLLLRLKKHLFAPRYLREKDQRIVDLKRQLKEMYEHVDTLKNDVSLLNQTLREAEQFLSYSQTGEDRIIELLFNILHIDTPSYLDIGANYPKQYSNTYVLYKRGCYGVCVEPDPELMEEFKKIREKDICLNIGIGTKEGVLPFYIFEDIAKGLNTFSKEQADHVVNQGKYKVAQVQEVPVKNINKIIEENFESYPNFLTVDVEGLDFEIIQSLDLETYPIDVICVETITHGLETRTETKISNINEYMFSMGYYAYADTHINTIFVRQSIYTPEKHIENPTTMQ